MNLIVVALTALLAFASPLSWGEDVFVGIPLAKVEFSNEVVLRTKLKASQQREFQAVIVKKDGKYFWKTREMKELEKHKGGNFVTYQARDGSGIVRIDSFAASTANTTANIGYI